MILGRKFMNTLSPASPHDRTTLILSKAYLPFGFLTARATMKYLMTGRVHGLDSNGNIVDFDNLLECSDFYENTPCLRTVNHDFPIPTVVISTRNFGYPKKTKSKYLSTKAVYRLYRGICQYCLEKISPSEATKDHYVPRSAGGTNHDFNLVLACKKCNQIKDSQFPYYNINGEPIKPKNADNLFVNVDVNFEKRPEWEQFLLKS